MAIAETVASGPSPDEEPATGSTPDTKGEVFHGRSPFQIAMRRLRKDKVAVVCAAFVLLLLVLAIFAPLINNVLELSSKPGQEFSEPAFEVLEFDGLPASDYRGFTAEHPLGLQPQTGNDNLARLLLGIRTSLAIATIATVVSVVVGVVIGLVAGFARGWIDGVIAFITDLFLSFPFILGALSLAPIIVTRFGSDADTLGRAQFFALVAVLVFFGWMGLARLVRGQVLSLREREFVQAAQVIGAPTRRILFKELLPNLVAPIVISVSLGLPAFVAAEAGLSFLGIGLTGVPSLGQTVNDARNWFEAYPLYLWVPVGTICVLVLALNLLGDSIRDAFDPKTRR